VNKHACLVLPNDIPAHPFRLPAALSRDLTLKTFGLLGKLPGRYTDFIHLLPAYFAFALYVLGLILLYPYLNEQHRKQTIKAPGLKSLWRRQARADMSNGEAHK
jgi:hypothetical protein